MDVLITLAEKLITPVLVGIILYCFEKKRDKREKQLAENEKKRRINERIQVTLLVATAKLCLTAARSIKNNENMPDLDDKIAKAEDAMGKFATFERELVADARLDM